MPKKSVATRKLSAREQRNLEIEIGFMEGIVRRDPSYVEALQILGDGLTRYGRFQEGLEVDERLAILRPNDPMVVYNLACSYALTKKYAQAAESIDLAIDLGYRDFKWLSQDPDLRGLRRTAHFKRIRARVKALKAEAAS